ncbi:MAG: diaminopimelate epimerase [Propionibacteriaceae bacterium]|nr:diaminopimelate epimerase [Propionibacteriaceae bacterium]
MTPELVRRVCDRHAGIGADGVIRAVMAKHIPEWHGDPDLWFMDYWNADGTVAEMCGNGLRVFVRYLMEEDLAPRTEVYVATRAGLRIVVETPSGELKAEMGPAKVGATTWLEASRRRLSAVAADVGNPHIVAMLPPDIDLEALDLRNAPVFDVGMFPNGANAEFVRIDDDARVSMRVFERGVGETRSCGTGVVAAAAVARQLSGDMVPRYTVNVPGGRLFVDFEDDMTYLTGPSVIVARGEMTLPENAHE